MMGAPFADSFSFLMTSFFSRGTMYRGAKSSSTFTPSCDFGRSRTCPTDAWTSYLLPRMLESVRAFAGDSTITRLLPEPLVFVDLDAVRAVFFFAVRLRAALAGRFSGWVFLGRVPVSFVLRFLFS